MESDEENVIGELGKSDSENPENGHPNSGPVGKPQEILPEARLADLPERLQEGVARAGWSELMPVQARAIPYLFAGRDQMIQSRTGSGKTGAYLLPIFELVNPMQPACQALVLVPTRELALQVLDDAQVLGASTGVRSVAVYGGVGYGPQLDAFRQGAQLVVGTPGRVLDHLLKRSLSLEHLRILVFDEADRLLSMGFYPDMRRVQSYLPQQPISTYMFSATFPTHVLRLADQFMRKPGFLNLSGDQIHVTDIDHRYYTVPGMDKDRSLVRIIEVENPPNALIFCNTRARVSYVTVVLQRFGYDADGLSSDLTQAAREAIMQRVRNGELRFLIATDVAARGIDLPELSHVILYEPPEDPEAYIHRAGRTGRAGAGGTAISLVNPNERSTLTRIGKRYGIDLQEQPLPTDEDVEQMVAQRAIALLEARLRERDRLKIERMQRFVPIVRKLGDSDDELAGIAMLLDDFYQEAFHGPIPIPTAQPQAASKGGGTRRRRIGGGRRRK